MRIAIDEIKRANVLTFREWLQQRRWNGRPLTPNTINHEVGYLRTMFAWAVDGDLLESNPVSRGLRVKDRRPVDARRAHFTDEDLLKVFDEAFVVEASHPGNLWVPLLMLHQGMRLEEASQLTRGDIGLDPLPTVAVAMGEGKRVKRLSSVRTLPLHPALIECGLLDYCQGISGDGELFPHLHRSSRNRKGETVSRWFNERLRRLGFTDPRVSLYSARHTFATTLKAAAVPDYLIMEAMGHSNTNMSTRLYGKAVDPKALMEHAISKVDFPLDDLYRALKRRR